MRMIRELAAGLFCIILWVFGLFMVGGVLRVEAGAADHIPERMKLAAASEELELYIDEELTDIAVRVKDTGTVWFSNPLEALEDGKASEYYKKLMCSQFSIRYFNQNVQAAEMDNYNDCIEDGQFEISYNENGVSIVYTLGETADKLILPKVISEERFLYFTENMDAGVFKKVSRNYTFLSLEKMKDTEKDKNLALYPALEEQNLYVLKEGTKDYMQEEIMEYFEQAGYTAQDMESDHTQNGFEADSKKPWFRIPLTYSLEGGELVVEIDPSRIAYDTSLYYLVDIDVLEYFGAAGIGQEGYLFVPDGSGALIYLNNGKTNDSAYIAQVYGQDETNQMIAVKKSETSQEVTVRMPVFGLKEGDKAWFAIIEGGDALADINAEIAGRTNSYNNVYAGFSYLSYGAISLNDMVGTNSFQMYSRPEFTESYRIRYSFLEGKEADYSGMAACYREYLEEREVLNRAPESDNIPFYVDFIGGIDKYKSVMGIKYKSIQSLTTYAQAKEIVDELQGKGIENLKLKFSGWYQGGLKGAAPGAARPLSQLEKGGVSIKEFNGEMADRGIPVFLSAQLQYVYKEIPGDGYSPQSNGPRYYDKSIVRAGTYLIPNGYLDNNMKKGIQMISPYYVEQAAEQLLKKTEKLSLYGMDVGTLTSNLYADYMDSRYTDRQKAAQYISQALEIIKEAGADASVMGSNANAFTFQSLTDILNVPFDSNRTALIDEVIPFYGMVLHGYMDFAGEPLNMADDYTISLLKSVETGAGLSFQWIYESNHVLKDTEYDYLYAVNYQLMIEKAIQSYQRVNESIGSLQGLVIVRHDKLQDKVYQTTYEDGTQILVNYNTHKVVLDDIILEAQDFAIGKEGGL